MVTTTVPKDIKENLARAKAYLKRDDTIRSLEAAVIALKAYTRVKIVGNNKFVTEVGIQEYIGDVNRQNDVRNFFIACRITKEPFVVYKAGQEGVLADRLESIVNGMNAANKEAAHAEEEKQHAERLALLRRGLELLYTKGEEPKGKGVLRRYLDEYGAETGVISEIANHFLKAKLFFEAAELFDQAIEKFPTDPKGYVGSIHAYTELGEHEKVETVYKSILKNFGAHPKTYLNFSKFYLNWHKKDLAYTYATQAIQGDPSLKEAQAIIDKIDKKA